MPDPSSSHPANFVQTARNEEQLLSADPSPVVNEPPQDPKRFEPQVQLIEKAGFFGAADVDGANGQQQRVKRFVVEPLAKSKPLRFREAGGPVERPANGFGQARVDGRTLRGIHSGNG